MHSHLAKMLGQYIFDTRQKKSMKQRELASSLNISAQFLGRIERGEVMIPDEALAACIAILNLSQNQLVTIYRAGGEKRAKHIFQCSKTSYKAKKAR